MAKQIIDVIPHGILEVERAFTETVIEVDPALSKQIRSLAEPVKTEAMSAASVWEGGGPGQSRTAAGFRIRRRGLGVRVEQGLSKTTGFHPNYGGVEMRHFLLPALEQHQQEIESGVGLVIDGLVARKF